MSENETGPVRGYVLQAGDGEGLPDIGVVLKAAGADTGGRASVVEVINPGFGGPPLHVHREVDELLYVLEGEYLFQVGDEITKAGRGGFACAPRTVPHTFASTGRAPGRLLNIGLPAGLENYVRDLDRIVREGGDERALDELNAASDVEMVGPPLSLSDIG